ncbi:MAG: proliferating cell nuclear antigen (pcna) [Candidatus Hadarchaeota archaeon]
MVRVKMEDSKVWKSCVKAMVNIIEEASFKFTPEKVKMMAMDPSHVALVDFELPASAFSEYEVEEPATIGVNLMEMDKVLSRAKPDDELAMELDDKQSRLNFTFKGASTRKLNMALIDVREAELKEPKIQFTATAEVLAGVLQDGLKDAELVGDKVRFDVKDKELSMVAEGDKGTSELKLGDKDEGLVKLKADRPAGATFGIRYLADMVGGAGSGDQVSISLGSDLPIQLDLPIAGGKGRLRFLLAPRIEAE